MTSSGDVQIFDQSTPSLSSFGSVKTEPVGNCKKEMELTSEEYLNGSDKQLRAVRDIDESTTMGIKHEIVDIPMEEEPEAALRIEEESAGPMAVTNSRDSENKNPIEEVFVKCEKFDVEDGEDAAPQQGDLDSRDPLQFHRPPSRTATEDSTTSDPGVQPATLSSTASQLCTRAGAEMSEGPDSPPREVANDADRSTSPADERTPPGGAGRPTRGRPRGHPADPPRPAIVAGVHYICNVCNKNFTNSAALATHKLLHSAEEGYPCDSCDKVFVHLAQLIRHKSVHTGMKPYSCDTCHKRFSQRTNLARHMYTHSGEKPYPCDNCGRRFTQLSLLIEHWFTHTGKKPYACETCDKRFSQLSNLSRHKTTHIGVRKLYECGICDKRFLQVYNLNRHVLTHRDEKS